MGLYRLDQAVIADCLALISSPTLQIAASQAARVATLQATLARASEVADREKDYAELLELWKKSDARALELEAERDTARAVAVTLEQSVAELKEQIAQLEHARAYAQQHAISHE